jgi:hypothetical protein
MEKMSLPRVTSKVLCAIGTTSNSLLRICTYLQQVPRCLQHPLQLRRQESGNTEGRARAPEGKKGVCER